MAKQIGSPLQLHENELLGARLELRPTLPTGAVSGRIGYVSASLLGYDGVDMAGHPVVSIVDGASSQADFRFLPGLNRNEAIVGIWTFAPSQDGSTTKGLNTSPPAPSVPQGIGSFSPFLIGGQSRLASGFTRTPDTDGAGDLAQPATGLKRYVPSWIQHLGADLLDGYHATVETLAYAIPVRVDGGHLRVPSTPIEDDHAASKGYVDSNRAAVRSRTACRAATTTSLPAYTYASASRTFTATANGALTVGGVAVAAGDRVIVKNEGDATKNCVATVEDEGDGSNPYQLRKVYSANPDPDGLGEHAFGDLFAVLEGTLAGTVWQLGGGTAGDVPEEGTDDVAFTLFLPALQLTGGRGMVVSAGKAHFWKAAYAASELNTIPYLANDLDGTSALGSVGLFGASGSYSLKGTNYRVPRGSTDAGAVFADSILEEASDGSGIHASAASKALGKSATPWGALWLATTAAGGKLTHVDGLYGGATQLVRRAWADFLTDIQADLPFGSYVPTSRTLQFDGPGDGSVVVNPSSSQSLASDRSWTISINLGFRTLNLSSPANHLTFSTTEGGAYSATLGQTLGSDRTWWLKLPQDLHAAASPTFVGATMTGLSTGAALAHVLGQASGGDGLVRRTFADFLTDVAGAITIAASRVTLATGAVGYGASGVLSGDTAKLFFDAGNVRLGIGTASPAYGLDVQGDGIVRVASNTPRVILYEADGPTNEKRFDLKMVGGDLSVVAVNDALAEFAEPLKFVNAGTAVAILLSGSTYLNGRLGIGQATPGSLLHLGAGTTAVPPQQFDATGNALLTTPVAGALETDLATATQRARLYFTDGNPTRRALAFRDDVNFTDDPAAAPGGGLRFPGPAEPILCTSTSEVLGTGPFSFWVRAEIRADNNPSSTYPTLACVHSATTPDAIQFFAYIEANGSLSVVSRLGATTANDAQVFYSGFRSRYGGQIVDIVLVRDSSGVQVYVNGERLARTSGALETDIKFQRDMTAAAEFRVGSTGSSAPVAFDGAIYRAVLYNRALSEADCRRVTLYGLDPADQWGTQTALIAAGTLNGGFETAGGGGADVFGTWTETTAGGSTIARDTSVFRSGAASCRFDVDVSGSAVTLASTASMTWGRRYRFSCYARGTATSARVGINVGSATYQPAGAAVDNASWQYRELEFVAGDPANGAVGNAGFVVARYVGTVDGSLWIDDLKLERIGALVDLDLAIGAGTVIPDRSSRYPAAVTLSTPRHLVPIPTGSGSGTFGHLRKFVQTISVTDDTNQDVTHGFGTENLSGVAVWNSSHQLVEVAVTRKSGNTSNAITLGFGKFGAPVTPENLTVVITA